MGTIVRKPSVRTRLAGLALALLALAGAVQACRNPLAEAAKEIKAEAASPRLVLSSPDSTIIDSGGSFDFGTASTVTLRIRNIGSSDLVLDLPAATWTWGPGTTSGDFALAASAVTVGAGKNADIIVKFEAMDVTPKSATLTIPTNDIKNAAYTINLKGQHGATDLVTLTISNSVALVPAFNSTITNYDIYLPNSTGMIDSITPWKANPASTVISNPDPLANIVLNEGSNPISITVSAPASADKTYTINAIRAPAAPTMSAGDLIPGNAEISGITCSTVTGATSYNLYWSTSSGVTKANGTKVSSISRPYTQTGLAPNKRYYYVITAERDGVESLVSNEVSALTYPAVPVATATVLGAEAAVLTWSATNGAASYRIWYSPTPGAETLCADGITGTTTTIRGLKTSMAYYFKVSAVNASAESAMSAEVSAVWTRQEVILVNPAGSVDFDFVNASTWTYTQPSPHYVTASGSAYSVAIDPDLKAVFVANNATSGTYFAVGTYRPFDTGSGLPLEYVPGETHAEGVGAEHLITVVTPGGNKFLYAAYKGSNLVYTYRINANGSIALTGTQVTGLVTPRYLCADPAGKFLYISNIDAGLVTACSIDPINGALTYINGSTSMPAPSSYTTGSAPFRMAIDPSGKHLYVVNNLSGNVSAFGIASDGKLTSIATYATGSAPTGVAVAPSGNYLYVTNAFSGTGTVSAFSIAADGSLSGKVDYAGAVNQPSCIAIDATGTYAVVTNAGSNNATVFAIDPATGILTGKFAIPTGAGPSHVIITKLP